MLPSLSRAHRAELSARSTSFSEVGTHLRLREAAIRTPMPSPDDIKIRGPGQLAPSGRGDR